MAKPTGTGGSGERKGGVPGLRGLGDLFAVPATSPQVEQLNQGFQQIVAGGRKVLAQVPHIAEGTAVLLSSVGIKGGGKVEKILEAATTLADRFSGSTPEELAKHAIASVDQAASEIASSRGSLSSDRPRTPLISLIAAESALDNSGVAEKLVYGKAMLAHIIALIEEYDQQPDVRQYLTALFVAEATDGIIAKSIQEDQTDFGVRKTKGSGRLLAQACALVAQHERTMTIALGDFVSTPTFSKGGVEKDNDSVVAANEMLYVSRGATLSRALIDPLTTGGVDVQLSFAAGSEFIERNTKIKRGTKPEEVEAYNRSREIAALNFDALIDVIHPGLAAQLYTLVAPMEAQNRHVQYPGKKNPAREAAVLPTDSPTVAYARSGNMDPIYKGAKPPIMRPIQHACSASVQKALFYGESFSGACDAIDKRAKMKTNLRYWDPDGKMIAPSLLMSRSDVEALWIGSITQSTMPEKALLKQAVENALAEVKAAPADKPVGFMDALQKHLKEAQNATAPVGLVSEETKGNELLQAQIAMLKAVPNFDELMQGMTTASRRYLESAYTDVVQNLGEDLHPDFTATELIMLGLVCREGMYGDKRGVGDLPAQVSRLARQIVAGRHKDASKEVQNAAQFILEACLPFFSKEDRMAFLQSYGEDAYGDRDLLLNGNFSKTVVPMVMASGKAVDYLPKTDDEGPTRVRRESAQMVFIQALNWLHDIRILDPDGPTQLVPLMLEAARGMPRSQAEVQAVKGGVPDLSSWKSPPRELVDRAIPKEGELIFELLRLAWDAGRRYAIATEPQTERIRFHDQSGQVLDRSQSGVRVRTMDRNEVLGAFVRELGYELADEMAEHIYIHSPYGVISQLRQIWQFVGTQVDEALTLNAGQMDVFARMLGMFKNDVVVRDGDKLKVLTVPHDILGEGSRLVQSARELVEFGLPADLVQDLDEQYKDAAENVETARTVGITGGETVNGLTGNPHFHAQARDARQLVNIGKIVRSTFGMPSIKGEGKTRKRSSNTGKVINMAINQRRSGDRALAIVALLASESASKQATAKGLGDISSTLVQAEAAERGFTLDAVNQTGLMTTAQASEQLAQALKTQAMIHFNGTAGIREIGLNMQRQIAQQTTSRIQEIAKLQDQVIALEGRASHEEIERVTRALDARIQVIRADAKFIESSLPRILAEQVEGKLAMQEMLSRSAKVIRDHRKEILTWLLDIQENKGEHQYITAMLQLRLLVYKLTGMLPNIPLPNVDELLQMVGINRETAAAAGQITDGGAPSQIKVTKVE